MRIWDESGSDADNKAFGVYINALRRAVVVLPISPSRAVALPSAKQENKRDVGLYVNHV